MPLPDRNQSWPPKALEPVLARIDLWSAWYSGSPPISRRPLLAGLWTPVSTFSGSRRPDPGRAW
jgi:hypothetical protein